MDRQDEGHYFDPLHIQYNLFHWARTCWTLLRCKVLETTGELTKFGE